MLIARWAGAYDLTHANPNARETPMKRLAIAVGLLAVSASAPVRADTGFGVRAEYELFETSGDNVQMYSLGAEMYF